MKRMFMFDLIVVPQLSKHLALSNAMFVHSYLLALYHIQARNPANQSFDNSSHSAEMFGMASGAFL